MLILYWILFWISTLNFALKIAEFLHRYVLISNWNIQDTFLDIQDTFQIFGRSSLQERAQGEQAAVRAEAEAALDRDRVMESFMEDPDDSEATNAAPGVGWPRNGLIDI